MEPQYHRTTHPVVASALEDDGAMDALDAVIAPAGPGAVEREGCCAPSRLPVRRGRPA
ncbi:hypothetical protein [Streptomyces luteogriseus]|uniref:hypothetical protein n=1 Tax=Streptomyces luteogriseus TaxID=68233 RepID=UPI0037B7D642